MSMGTEWYADYATGIKNGWVKKLREAKTMEEVKEITNEIDSYLFGE